MTNLAKGLCWAAAMLFLAAGVRFGFMDRRAAMTMLIVVPILAVLSLRGSNCCSGEKA